MTAPSCDCLDIETIQPKSLKALLIYSTIPRISHYIYNATVQERSVGSERPLLEGVAGIDLIKLDSRRVTSIAEPSIDNLAAHSEE
jgi:hypothetical protein